jgi:hypothetical protein
MSAILSDKAFLRAAIREAGRQPRFAESSNRVEARGAVRQNFCVASGLGHAIVFK